MSSEFLTNLNTNFRDHLCDQPEDLDLLFDNGNFLVAFGLNSVLL